MKVMANRRGARLSGGLFLLAFVLAVVLATVWFVARTDGVRELLEKRISDRIGVAVSIGESAIGWPYELVLRDVSTAGFAAAGTPGFSTGEIRVGRRLFSWKVVLRHVALRVQQDESGIWQPLAAARIADLRQASAMDIIRLTEPLRGHYDLKIMDGMIDWLDADGRTDGALRDLSFVMQPITLPEKRKMSYYGLKIYAASGGVLGNAKDLSWVWLTSDDMPYVELERLVRHDDGITGQNPLAGGQDVE
jgi:hypothetical protein